MESFQWPRAVRIPQLYWRHEHGTNHGRLGWIFFESCIHCGKRSFTIYPTGQGSGRWSLIFTFGFLQWLLVQIDFVIGDPKTNAMGKLNRHYAETHLETCFFHLPAAKRAALGHPKPFTLNYVEVTCDSLKMCFFPFWLVISSLETKIF